MLLRRLVKSAEQSRDECNLLVQDCQIGFGLLRLMYGETGQVRQVANRLERTLHGMEYPAALSCILLCPQASRYQVVIHEDLMLGAATATVRLRRRK